MLKLVCSGRYCNVDVIRKLGESRDAFQLFPRLKKRKKKKNKSR